jgi:hypothetical protein
MQTKGTNWTQIVPIYNKIQKYLFESGYYAAYRDKFISVKLTIWYQHYYYSLTSMKLEFATMIRKSLTVDDRKFYRTAPKEFMPKHIRLFYKILDGGPIEVMSYHIFTTVREIIKWPERIVRRVFIKPLKVWLAHQSSNNG